MVLRAAIIWIIVLSPFLYLLIRTLNNTPTRPSRPLSRITYLILELLFVTAILAFLSSFSSFHPENILSLTKSHINNTATKTIFERLHALRSPIPSDEILEARFKSRTGRYLYSVYGPDPLINCIWCVVDRPMTFELYALPSILLPHLFHIVILGVVTSAKILGGNNKAGGVWRTQATLAGLFLAGGEIFLKFTYLRALAVAEKLADQPMYPYWRVLVLRGIAIAVVDGALGYAIHLTGTGRWGDIFVETPAESIEAIALKLENSIAAVNSAICVKQAVMRDHELRARAVQFWETEVQTATEVAKDDNVRAAKREVEQRPEWANVNREAKERARVIVGGLFGERPTIGESRVGQTEGSQSNAEQYTLTGSGHLTDGSQTEADDGEFEGMQYGSSRPSSMAGSFY